MKTTAIGSRPALLCLAALLASASFAGNLPQEDWKAPVRAAKKKSPVVADEKAAAAGKALYAQQCLSCHGAGGKGDGPAAKDLATKVGDLALSRAVAESDGSMFWKISEGRTPMPSYEKLLGEEDRWRVVVHVRVLTLAEPRRALSAVLEPYSKARAALVKDDLAGARAVLPGIDEAIGKAVALKPAGIDEKAQAAWAEVQQTLAGALRGLRAAEDLGAYRRAYQELSTALRGACSRFGHAESEPLRVMRCASGPESKDAVWIQAGDAPQNPYLGAKDPACGESEARLEPVVSSGRN